MHPARHSASRGQDHQPTSRGSSGTRSPELWNNADHIVHRSALSPFAHCFPGVGCVFALIPTWRQLRQRGDLLAALSGPRMTRALRARASKRTGNERVPPSSLQGVVHALSFAPWRVRVESRRPFPRTRHRRPGAASLCFSRYRYQEPLSNAPGLSGRSKPAVEKRRFADGLRDADCAQGRGRAVR